MSTDSGGYYTHAHPDVLDRGVPAELWTYIGDGEWWAVGGKGTREDSSFKQAIRTPHLLTFLPIDQLPRDGLISYTTSKGKPVTERVERGEVI
jgi:hypothetical protein